MPAEKDKNNIAFQKLTEYFELNGYPNHVDGFKLGQRFTISQEKYKRGWVIIQIIRHRGLFNEIYVKGTPMQNYDTYAMQYAVNLKNGKVEELEEKLLERKLDLNRLVDKESSDWYVEVDKTTKYKIKISNEWETKNFKSLKEAKSGISEMINSLDYVATWADLSYDEEKTFKKLLSDVLYANVVCNWKKS